MINIKDIFESWMKTSDHTPYEYELALLRKSECDKCDSRKDGIMGFEVCGECGCPITHNGVPVGKLYTKEKCPKGKW